jgi:hypothetical protein
VGSLADREGVPRRQAILPIAGATLKRMSGQDAERIEAVPAAAELFTVR